MEKLLNKKGQLSLNTVQAVMITFLVIAVLAVTIILLNTKLSDTTDTIYTNTINFDNTTTATAVNYTGAEVGTYTSSNYRNCVLTVLSANNVSDLGPTISSSLYTTSGCSIYIVDGPAADGLNNTAWNITGSITYNPDQVKNVGANISSALEDFFSNTSTIFSILVVVVIILAIGIIIFVVQRFGGSDSGL